MAVTLPTTPGSVLTEWASTNISLMRQVQHTAEGVDAVFTASIAYSRIDYLVQNGKKIATVNTAPNGGPGMAGGGGSDYYGQIYVDAAKFQQIISNPIPSGVSAFEAISAMADELIREDLIARGLLIV